MKLQNKHMYEYHYLIHNVDYKIVFWYLYYELQSFLLNDASTVSIFIITFPEIMNREEISFKKSANSCVTKEA